MSEDPPKLETARKPWVPNVVLAVTALHRDVQPGRGGSARLPILGPGEMVLMSICRSVQLLWQTPDGTWQGDGLASRLLRCPGRLTWEGRDLIAPPREVPSLRHGLCEGRG